MRLYDQNGGELMRIESLERDGSELIIRGKVFGAMPLTARLRPEETRALWRLLNTRTLLFVLTMPFRRRRAS
ncbi:MAG TPA: hypothetical protein VMU67_17685 [Steroidobacteraceae bacterium]|nr:hypothetical protein [Steroidobacteraceae bacterium]